MLSGVTEQQMEQMRCEWRANLAQAELRMTKWMFITAIGTAAVVLLAAMPPVHGAGGVLFLAGSAVQMFAVARM